MILVAADLFFCFDFSFTCVPYFLFSLSLLQHFQHRCLLTVHKRVEKGEPATYLFDRKRSLIINFDIKTTTNARAILIILVYVDMTMKVTVFEVDDPVMTC